MSTNKSFSLSAFCTYGNECINGKNEDMQNAFKTDLKKAIVKAGFPSNKEELGVVDTINDFDISNTLSQVPAMVAGFMKDEQRAFNIPAADDNTCPATVKVVAVDKAVKEGTIMFGDKAGQTYKSVVAAHEELKVANNRNAFKK